ncbi:hypothetical protein BEI02_05225 [Elizabethkingia sp. HvH-WGS333]|uniref:DUF1259 domain-containing protein n=1 Tax=Flavobacteriales TaxID=200644 RepID=UPI0008F868BF|nr:MULTISPECIES: DUF1259 domain-containing protein [Flavobacteriales]MBL7869933.1 DUF1259 domain-containing protein [Flavobacterium lindanitolerans]OIK45012.1 hypothetical protein BEI02_05225 [Elizabethkingia sp. HvH-WGS333]
MKKTISILKLVAFSTIITLACSNNVNAQTKGQVKMMHNVADKKLDIAKIEAILEMKGVEKNGEFKITVPQNDLDIEVDGFKIIPPMGLGTWIAFTPTSDGAMIMGDVVITETDLKSVQFEVIKQGLTITAIHNHFVRNHPNVMYMHIGGSGPTEQMAMKAKAVLNKVKEMRGGDPSKGSFAGRKVENSIDTKKLDAILGITGEMNNGVYKYTIGRPDAPITEHGIPISTFFGYNTWIAIQGTEGKAAIAGDFAMLEDEVAPVIKALIENGIEVVAVHNHMVQEKPHVFFLHYWAIGNAEQLVKSLKIALGKTGKGGMEMKH